MNTVSTDFPLEIVIDAPLESSPRAGPGATGGTGAERLVELLRAEMASHEIWTCPLLRACRVGHLTTADWQFLFSQYSLYCASFTRFLAAAMAGCASDYYRAQLAINIWEEGGKLRPEERHAQIFRAFLRDGLAVAPEDIKYEAFTEHYVQQYLGHCYSGSAFVSAFLALGTEAAVARLYGIFHEGLLQAGLGEEQLRFFSIHMECDDQHAATLTEMMLSYAGEPDWEHQVRSGMHAALDLRRTFFDNLFQAMVQRRVGGLVRRIQDKQPLGPARPTTEEAFFARGNRGPFLYGNIVEKLRLEFAVEKVPFSAEVLDPRLVYIPPGRCNERHKHAHESLFVILAGEGRVRVGDVAMTVNTGDMVFVPRWVLHQTENRGAEEMVILAVTDHGLTSKAFVGDYDRTARLKRPAEASSIGH